jgi:hypothetical protein
MKILIYILGFAMVICQDPTTYGGDPLRDPTEWQTKTPQYQKPRTKKYYINSIEVLDDTRYPEGDHLTATICCEYEKTKCVEFAGVFVFTENKI